MVREAHTVHGTAVWQDSSGAWLLTGLRECTFVCSREDLFATEHAAFAGGELIRGRRSVALLDGDGHRRVHSLLASYFAGPRIEPLRTTVIRPVVERRIDAFAGDEVAELAAELADRVPGPLMSGLLGLPMDDAGLVRRYDRWNRALTPWVQTRGEERRVRDEALAAAAEMSDALLPHVRQRRARPRDDLVSLLWREGPSLLPGWSEEDVLDQCRIIFLAGGEGVAQLICTVAYLLLTASGLREDVERSRRDRLPQLVEEALRLHPPARLRPRRATRDVTLGGVRIRRGDLVYPDVDSANRDPQRFPGAASPDLDRPGRSRHLAFNVGPRHCVGAALSRATAFEAIDALLRRLPAVRLRTDAEPPALAGFRFRGHRPLHVRCR